MKAIIVCLLLISSIPVLAETENWRCTNGNKGVDFSIDLGVFEEIAPNVSTFDASKGDAISVYEDTPKQSYINYFPFRLSFKYIYPDSGESLFRLESIDNSEVTSDYEGLVSFKARVSEGYSDPQIYTCQPL